MDHGTQAYFDGLRRNTRRLSLLCMAVGMAMLAPFLLMRITPLGQAVRRIPIMRFGFEGTPRFVELVQVEAQPTAFIAPQAVGPVVVRSGRRGPPGSPVPHPKTDAPRARALEGIGAGEGGHDLAARALASQGSVPIFQSNELVIEELVRPEYPERARDRGIEGHVAVLALVDTLGRVSEAQVVSPSGEPELDRASWSAVLRCRFKPFRQEGRAQEVYAVFRFSFRIY